MSSFSKDNTTKGCVDQGICIKSLQLMLDGEVSEEVENKLMKHLEVCDPCYRLYDLEKAVKELVQTRVLKKPVPSSLLNDIRNQIFSNQTAL